jgi:hypothetical protein
VEETKDMQLHRKQASKILFVIHMKRISQVCIISPYHLHTSHTACPIEKSPGSVRFLSLLLRFSWELRIKYAFEVGV